MITSIVHKGLRLLWENDDPSKLPQSQVAKILYILEALDTAKDLYSLKKIPSLGLHSLTGNLKGFWSITVSRNYRIIFRFEGENVHLLDYMDYH